MGWPMLEYLSIEDNLISDWKTFDELNLLGSGKTETGHAARRLRNLRCEGNPLIPRFNYEALAAEKEQKSLIRAIAVGRLSHLTNFNGYDIKYIPKDRRDMETFYVQICYKEYLKQMNVENDKDRKIDSIDDPDFAQYIEKLHPRWF